jgi:hypothetical protein
MMGHEDDEALRKAIDHALDVADRECDTECGKEHRQLAGWLLELRTLRTMPNHDGFLALAFRYAEDGDREGFDLIVDLMAERDREVVLMFLERWGFMDTAGRVDTGGGERCRKKPNPTRRNPTQYPRRNRS